MKEAIDKIGRLGSAAVTAYDAEGRIDRERNVQLARHLAVTGSDFIVSAGTTGESPNLTVPERMNLINYAKEGANGRAKVVAGTGTNNCEESIELSKLAQQEGADALLVVVPPYSKPSQEGIFRHMAAVAGAVDIPVILYNVPGRTAKNMEAETVLRLDSEFPNVWGLKEAVGLKTVVDTERGITGAIQVATVLEGSSEGFGVWSGNDEETLAMMRMSADGVISVASHLTGHYIKKMMDYHLVGDAQRAQRMHDYLLPLFEALFPKPNVLDEPSPVAVKAMLNLSGIPVGGLRLPLVNMLEVQSKRYQDYVQKLQALVIQYNLQPAVSGS